MTESRSGDLAPTAPWMTICTFPWRTPRRGGRKRWQTRAKGAGLSDIAPVRVRVGKPRPLCAWCAPRLWGCRGGSFHVHLLGFPQGEKGERKRNSNHLPEDPELGSGMEAPGGSLPPSALLSLRGGTPKWSQGPTAGLRSGRTGRVALILNHGAAQGRRSAWPDLHFPPQARRVAHGCPLGGHCLHTGDSHCPIGLHTRPPWLPLTLRRKL